MLRRPRVYTASKLEWAKQFRSLREQYPNVEFTSRWIDMDHLETKAMPHQYDFTHFWTIDVADVLRSDVLICYGGEQLVLRGALVETGAAIGAGIPVFVVGHTDSFGTWQNHPNVIGALTCNQALDITLEWAKTWRHE